MISTRCRSPALRSPIIRLGSSGKPYSSDTALIRAASSRICGGFSIPRATFSATFSASNRLKCWNTIATPVARACAGAPGA